KNGLHEPNHRKQPEGKLVRLPVLLDKVNEVSNQTYAINQKNDFIHPFCFDHIRNPFSLLGNNVHWKGYTFTCVRSEEHTSELQSRFDLVCRLLLEKK